MGLKVSEVARLAGVSVRTLHHYEVKPGLAQYWRDANVANAARKASTN